MITDEMIEKSKTAKTHKGFAIIDDNYIIMTEGEGLQEFITKTFRLREKGVNYCGPVECRIENGVCYYLEHRAKGEVLQYSNYDLPIGKNTNLKTNYLNAFKEYMTTLKMLSDAPKEHYIKFFSDIEEMRKENLKPDICSLDNLLYDEEKGFSFIDVYPGNERIKVSNLFRIILNDRFKAKCNWNSSISILPSEYKDEYFSSIENVISKVLVGLKEFNYPVEEIKSFLEQNKYNFSTAEIFESSEIESKLKEIDEKNQQSRVWEI